MLSSRTPRSLRFRSVAALTAPVLGAWCACASAQDFMSQEMIKPGNETFTLNLGGIVNQFNTKLKLNGDTREGSDVDLESAGLKSSLSSFEVSGTWRFLPRHRIDVQYFSAQRSGGRTLDSEITIRDQVFPIGATISTEAKDHFLLADYRYSFIKNDDLEVAGLLGFYGGQFKFHVRAETNRSEDTVDTTASSTVPLPLIGATVDWYVNPRWKIAGSLAGIKADLGHVDGKAVVATASTEYMLVRNLGVGLRYMYSDVDATIDRERFDGKVTWRMNSWSLYAKMMF